MMTEEKNRDYKTLPTAEQDAKSLALFLDNCVRGDSMDILLRRVISAIQYDHPSYTKDDLNNDLSRAYSVITRISEEG